MKISPNKLRRKVLDMIYTKKSGHIGGSFSIAELVAVLYSDYDFTNRDKLILSKGHSVPIIYAALHEIGVLSDADIDLFREIDSPLQGHPVKAALPALHATTGSLGQGLSIAIGHALAFKLKGNDASKVFCIMGDGEIQEGQVWEAFMFASKMKLDNLMCFIDWNKYQNDGATSKTMPIYSNLKNKIASFGLYCETIDGHNMNEIRRVLEISMPKPKCIILDTIKGKGVSFMESQKWHTKIPTQEQYKAAIKELNE